MKTRKMAVDMTDAERDGTKTPDGPDEKKNFDHDGFWKDLIERFFYSLLKRALPELYEAADRMTPPRFLDKEFRDILNTADPKIHTSPHFADFVLEVPLKNGGEEWIILHLEAQGPGGGNLAVRMYTYKSLIFVHYQREPVALVIVTEKRPANEPGYYAHKRYGTESVYRYNMLVLLELDDKELLASDNPIDLVLYAAKFALKTKEERRKFNFLRKIVALLNERGWSMEEKRDLLLFVERIVNMTDEMLITQYREILEKKKEEGKAMYIPLLLRDSAAEIEQRGIEKGMEKGMEKGIEKMARGLLAEGVSLDVIARSSGLPLDTVKTLMN
jgi:predicted transposase/invertase (TIGR01784 family)